MDKLTPEQIENWRKVLAVTLGAYAFLITDEAVQKLRDGMQKKFGKAEELLKVKEA